MADSGGDNEGDTSVSTPLPHNHAKADKRQAISLLDLPDELWSLIGMMVVDEMPIVTTLDLRDRRRGVQCTRPALAQTCRLLHNELLPYYLLNKVSIAITAADFGDLSPWLQAIPAPHRKHLTHFWYCFTCPGSEKKIFVDWRKDFGIKAKTAGAVEKDPWIGAYLRVEIHFS